jgi:hypothetical protein
MVESCWQPRPNVSHQALKTLPSHKFVSGALTCGRTDTRHEHVDKPHDRQIRHHCNSAPDRSMVLTLRNLVLMASKVAFFGRRISRLSSTSSLQPLHTTRMVLMPPASELRIICCITFFVIHALPSHTSGCSTFSEDSKT